MDVPLAYLLTWTTYGTWLHGDERGSVNRSTNVYGRPVVPASAVRVRVNQSRSRADGFRLTPPMRAVVRDALVEHCPYRNVALHALNVRTNHVHMVVSMRIDEPGDLAGRFKARGTLVLRERGLVGSDAPVWTARGSTKYLWDDESLFRAIRYVLDEQGPRDEFAVVGSGRFERRTGESAGGSKRGGTTDAQPPASAGGSDQGVLKAPARR